MLRKITAFNERDRKINVIEQLKNAMENFPEEDVYFFHLSNCLAKVLEKTAIKLTPQNIVTELVKIKAEIPGPDRKAIDENFKGYVKRISEIVGPWFAIGTVNILRKDNNHEIH